MSLTRLARRKSFQCMHRYAVEGWTEELNAIGLYLEGFGARMPERLKAERLHVSKALEAAMERRAANVA